MELILLEKIPKLGELGARVQVRKGYGRNYLIPQGKAVFATDENIATFESRRAELEVAQAKTLRTSMAYADKLNETEIIIAAKATTEGHLFGSINAAQIADAVSATGIELDKRQVRLPAGPFRTLGEFTVAVHLHADINAAIKLKIIAEE